jgi:hypothetical protein
MAAALEQVTVVAAVGLAAVWAATVAVAEVAKVALGALEAVVRALAKVAAVKGAPRSWLPCASSREHTAGAAARATTGTWFVPLFRSVSLLALTKLELLGNFPGMAPGRGDAVRKSAVRCAHWCPARIRSGRTHDHEPQPARQPSSDKLRFEVSHPPDARLPLRGLGWRDPRDT